MIVLSLKGTCNEIAGIVNVCAVCWPLCGANSVGHECGMIMIIIRCCDGAAVFSNLIGFQT